MSGFLLDNWRDEASLEKESMRVGFGRGLRHLANENENVVALSADLADSVGFGEFVKEIGKPRYIEVGVAEQNLVTVASGLAAMGHVPFAASYAAFSPGRNWEQIRTAIALNNQPVKLVGSHAGLNVGPDGATHQMLEDIALMRSMPNMVVLAPGDSREAEKVAWVMSQNSQPNYVRLPREASAIFTKPEAHFEIGKAYVLREGEDVSLMGTGTMTYQLLLAADMLANEGVNAEVVHVPTIKPLDEEALLASGRKCGKIVTAEEAQISGGFGGAVAELFSEKSPTRIMRLGVDDKFGESGTAEELLSAAGLTAEKIKDKIKYFLGG